MGDIDIVLAEEREELGQYEQSLDLLRAETELEALLFKVETGMAGKPEAQEIRELINLIAGTEL